MEFSVLMPEKRNTDSARPRTSTTNWSHLGCEVAVTNKWTRQAVEELISKLERCVVPKEEWTHEAHLVAGLWYTYSLGSGRALDEIRTRIRRHNESVGTPNTDDSGYHETLTRLYLRGIENELGRVGGQDLESSLATLLASDVADRAWPLRFYSRARLFSVQARRAWVEPDLPHLIPGE